MTRTTAAAAPRILVIDDEADCQEVVVQALRGCGFEVLTATGGTEGVALARQHCPDLVISDVQMARGDGYFALQQLRQDRATATVPIIMISGVVDHEGFRRGMDLGADDFLIKPFTSEEL